MDKQWTGNGQAKVDKSQTGYIAATNMRIAETRMCRILENIGNKRKSHVRATSFKSDSGECYKKRGEEKG